MRYLIILILFLCISCNSKIFSRHLVPEADIDSLFDQTLNQWVIGMKNREGNYLDKYWGNDTILIITKQYDAEKTVDGYHIETIQASQVANNETKVQSMVNVKIDSTYKGYSFIVSSLLRDENGEISMAVEDTFEYAYKNKKWYLDKVVW